MLRNPSTLTVLSPRFKRGVRGNLLHRQPNLGEIQAWKLCVSQVGQWWSKDWEAFMRFYQKISLSFILLSVVALGTIFSLLYYGERAALIEQAHRRANLLGKAIQVALTEIIENPSINSLEQLSTRERVLLQRFIRQFGEADGFSQISVFNREQGVVINYGDAHEWAPLPSDQATLKRLNQLGKDEIISLVEKTRQGGLTTTVIIPLDYDGKILGFAKVKLTLKETVQRLAETLRVSFILLAATLALVVLISLFLGMTMAKPVERLVAGVRKIADGNYDIALPIHGRGEIFELTQAFNYMVNNLKRLQAERQLREALKVAGELGRSVAHEIRNPLNLILLSVEQLPHLFQGGAADRKRAEKLMGTIKSEISRISGIIQNFLEYAHTQALARTSDSILDLLQSTATLVGPQAVKQRVDLKVEVEKNLGPVPHDPNQMRQALLNLIVNALQAMPRGGRLVLSAERQKSWVHIQVADQGVGISSENLEKIFEPDFSTKAGGNGIGLALVKRISEQHGGRVAVSSRVGQGSQFSIWIPVLDQSEVAEERTHA
jgi:signal transduction histidine kinase